MNYNLALRSILAVAFVCLVKETYGLECYECEPCNDIIDSNNTPVIHCNGSCMIVNISGNIARACNMSHFDNGCGQVIHAGKQYEGYFCNSDRCNGISAKTLSEMCNEIPIGTTEKNGGSVERLSVMLSVTIFVVMVLKAMVW